MSELLQRIMGSKSTSDTDSEENDLTNREVAELVLNDMLEEDISSISDTPLDVVVGSDALQEIKKLAVYEEGRNDSRMIGVVGRNPDAFDAHIRILDEGDFQIKLQSIFYTDNEPTNKAVGDFVRTFGYRGPDVKFDIESDEPQMRVFSFS